MSLLKSLIDQLCTEPLPEEVPPPSRKIFREPTRYQERVTCRKCGKKLDSSEFYVRLAAGDKSHYEGAIMQPCKACTLKKQAAYRERKRAARPWR